MEPYRMPRAIARNSFLSLLALAGLAPAALRAEPSPAPVAHVTIKDLAFVPKVLHVKTGTTVIWTNGDDLNHTVTSGKTADDGAWESSPEIAGGKTFSHTFAKSGTYPYYCKPHSFSEQMHGTIIVDD
jgi:plastocyanin